MAKSLGDILLLSGKPEFTSYKYIASGLSGGQNIDIINIESASY